MENNGDVSYFIFFVHTGNGAMLIFGLCDSLLEEE